MEHKSFNWNGLINRIIYIFPHLPQKAIAEKLDVSQHLLSGWKTGRSHPSLEVIETASRVGGVDVKWLLFGKSQNIDFLVDVHSRCLESEVADQWLFDAARRLAGFAAITRLRNVFGERVVIERLYKAPDVVILEEYVNQLFFAATRKLDWLNIEKYKESNPVIDLLLGREDGLFAYICRNAQLEAALQETPEYYSFKQARRIIDSAIADCEGPVYFHSSFSAIRDAFESGKMKPARPQVELGLLLARFYDALGGISAYSKQFAMPDYMDFSREIVIHLEAFVKKIIPELMAKVGPDASGEGGSAKP